MYFEYLWEKIALKYSCNDIPHMQPTVGKME